MPIIYIVSRMNKILFMLASILVSLNTVSAYNQVCNFSGAVHLDGGDLPNYTNDQIACGMQRISDSWASLIIAGVVFLGLMLIYGLSKIKR